MSAAERSFIGEVSALVGKPAAVVTVDGKTYSGTLVGISPSSLNLCLADARNPEGQVIPRLVLTGATVAQILSVEKAFDLRGLAERLDRVFPRMVKLYEKEGFIWVMDRVKVTESGIVEGSGPAAERVHKVYSQFKREAKGT